MSLSQYWLNKLVDANLRAQSITFPATRHLALFTVAPTRSTTGTELTTGAGFTGYARQPFAASLTNWSGTQGAGTTAVSSGTNDYVTNNVAVTFSAALTAAWPGIVAWGFFDAATAGNLLEFGSIVNVAGTPVTRSFTIDDPVVFPIGALKSVLA